MPLTITEALAEIKTISKRLDKKRASIIPYLFRQEGLKDPLEKSGGSVDFIRTESQSIKDLENNIVSLRTGIANANADTHLTVGDASRSIAEWLIWRREVAPGQKAHIIALQSSLANMRANASRQGARTVTSTSDAQAPTDFIVNVDELELTRAAEQIDTILSTLDGQLSKLNATTLLLN